MKLLEIIIAVVLLVFGILLILNGLGIYLMDREVKKIEEEIEQGKTDLA